MEPIRSYCSIRVGHPVLAKGMAPALHVTAYMLAKSPKVTLYTGGSDGFVSSVAALIATGGANQLPGSG